MKKILPVLFTAAVVSLHGQNSGIPAAQLKLNELKGTYELKQLGREMGTLPSNLAEIIEKNRKTDIYDTLFLNQSWALVIYPKNRIAPALHPKK